MSIILSFGAYGGFYCRWNYSFRLCLGWVALTIIPVDLDTLLSKLMADELSRKVLKLAAQICWMHGNVAGNRVCQDWSGKVDILDSLTIEERDQLSFDYQQYNSNGEDFEPGYFPYDEMLISFIVARKLELMAEKGEK